MNKLVLFLSILFCTPLALAVEQKEEPIAVVIKDASGKQMGNLVLTKVENGVKVSLHLTNLKPGKYAVHFHEKGKCIPPDFKSAGDHFNPTKTKHGFSAKGGPHAGDMKNIEILADGSGNLEEVNTKISLDEGLANSLLQPDGTTIIIHEKPDDYMSQPVGKAGARIGCGEIKTPDRTKQ